MVYNLRVYNVLRTKRQKSTRKNAISPNELPRVTT